MRPHPRLVMPRRPRRPARLHERLGQRLVREATGQPDAVRYEVVGHERPPASCHPDRDHAEDERCDNRQVEPRLLECGLANTPAAMNRPFTTISTRSRVGSGRLGVYVSSTSTATLMIKKPAKNTQCENSSSLKAVIAHCAVLRSA